VNGPRNRSRTHASGPVRRPGLSWGYAWQVLGSNQRRRMPAILQEAHCHPSEWPLTCRFPIPRRVKTASCPRGVRNPGVCLVSATQVLDHVPRSPAECHCVQFSCRHRPSSASARQSLRHRPAAADGPRQTRHIAAPQKSGLSGHFPRPCHGSWPRPAQQNRPARSHHAPRPPAHNLSRRDGPRQCRLADPMLAKRREQTASAPRDLPSQPDHSLRAKLLTATDLRCTWHLPRVDQHRHQPGQRNRADASDSAESSALRTHMTMPGSEYVCGVS